MLTVTEKALAQLVRLCAESPHSRIRIRVGRG